MNSSKPRLKRGAKKRLIRRFITMMLSTFVIGTGLVIGGLATYQHLSKEGNIFEGFPKISAGEKEVKEEVDKFKTNVAVFGVDIDGYRTDTMFVVHFDAETNAAGLVSIPRDTKVRLSETEHEKIRQFNRNAPKTMKINEMTAYAGIKNINDFTVKEIERILGIKIDNYVTVEIEAFRKIVDLMDGVEVNVPTRMKYKDNSQKLYIDLEPGLQTLDGAAAEGMVRFRKGAGADGTDTGRIERQQIFLKAFAQKLLSKENIPNLPKMVPAMFQHVKTDINILDLPKYYGYATNFSIDSISFHTIPGVAKYQNGVSYFFPDMDVMDDFVQETFYKKPGTEAEESDAELDKEVIDKNVKIEILNGGGVAGAAGSLKEIIEKDGYDVVNIANYKGTKKEEVIIYAKDISKAEQFKQYFSNCTVSMDSAMDDRIDIQIVIGSQGI